MRKEHVKQDGDGFTVLEVLVALTLIVLVVFFTGRVIVTTLALLGRGSSDYQRAARTRSQAIEWTQAATEFVRKIGLAQVRANCATPCLIPPGNPPSGATAPFDQGPPLPAGFQCGRVVFGDWDGSGGFSTTDLGLVTVEVYRGGANCSDTGPTPYIRAYTGISR